VKHGSPGMLLHHLRPARIPKRIDLINRHHRRPNAMDHIDIDVHKKESQICILAEEGATAWS